MTTYIIDGYQKVGETPSPARKLQVGIARNDDFRVVTLLDLDGEVVELFVDADILKSLAKDLVREVL